MDVLVIGSGGREHAIIWSLYQSPNVSKIYALPGNGGTDDLAENVALSETDFPAIEKLVTQKDIDLIVVGPEVPLVAGIVDYFEARNIKIFGPNKTAAQLEGSKAFSKRFMKTHGIPTAAYETFSDVEKAKSYLSAAQYPIVIKADGLAAGKGVVIAHNQHEALQALETMMMVKVFGEAGTTVVIEQFLMGEEASILAFVDQYSIIPMVTAQDHKAIYDGDQGPNTGGMGAYSPAPVVTEAVMEKVKERVFNRVMEGFRKEGIIYRGILYAGLMIHKGEPYVLEFNVRFGDPETQAVLPRLNSDLYDIMNAVCLDQLSEAEIEWKAEQSVSVVLASQGYPGQYEKGKIITGLENAIELVFQAGTKRQDGKLLTAGGRVMAVTALDESLPRAIDRAYEDVRKIHFDGKYFRSDIGKKALKYL